MSRADRQHWRKIRREMEQRHTDAPADILTELYRTSWYARMHQLGQILRGRPRHGWELYR